MDIEDFNPSNDNAADFYVYAWLRPNGEPFYIGKGRGNRDKAPKYSNQIFMRILAKMRREGIEPSIVRLAEGLTEAESFAVECEEIAKHGRLNNRTGVLANLTDGGEGNSGWIPSEETRAKIGAAHRGKTLSAEHCAKLLEARLNITDETRARMSASQTGRKHTAETRALMSENNGSRRPDVAAKISAALVGKPKSDEHRAKLSVVRSNISADTRAQISAANRMRGPLNGYKGVSFTSANGKWRASIRLGDKRPFLGYFVSADDAARAYDAAAIKAWGACNCYLNFPPAVNDNEHRLAA